MQSSRQTTIRSIRENKRLAGIKLIKIAIHIIGSSMHMAIFINTFCPIAHGKIRVDIGKILRLLCERNTNNRSRMLS